MNTIDISSEEKKEEIYRLFKSFNKKGEIYQYFKIPYNTKGVAYVNEVGKQINFDFNFYKNKNRQKRFCLNNCGNELKSSQKKFCSCKCSEEYKHKESYLNFLKFPEKFCNGGYTPKNFKEDILREQNYECAIQDCPCKTEWNGKPLVFVLDHIDGDASNNRRENLRMICPNCDSQLDTFKSKNKNSKRRNYWKENIIKKLDNK
jgi:hypothetical protein